MVISMEIDNLLEMIELETGQKIINTAVINGGNRIKKQHLKVTFADGDSLLLKKCKMSQTQIHRLREICNYAIPQFQKVVAVYPVAVDEYYILMEWKEGFLLNEYCCKTVRDEFTNSLREAAMALRCIHENTKTKKKVNITLDRVNDIKNKAFLTTEQKEVIIQYITSNLPCLNNRYESIIHGDLHLANILVADKGVIFLDLDDVGFGDPFMDLVYAAHLHYSKKELLQYYYFLQYYFNNKIPKEFWRIVNVYSLIKAMNIIEAEIRNSETHTPVLSIASLLSEHDNMTYDEPNWFIAIERQYK